LRATGHSSKDDGPSSAEILAGRALKIETLKRELTLRGWKKELDTEVQVRIENQEADDQKRSRGAIIHDRNVESGKVERTDVGNL